LELGEETSRVNVDDGFREDVALVVDSFDFHTIFERLEVELLEESSF
jgi:hypothetical protein